MQKTKDLLRYWFGGIRIYIGLAAVLVTFAVWWWGHTLFGGSQLEIIRIQEVYGWLTVGLLALVLAIGPVTKLFPKIPGKAIIFDSRRALGLSAAWFALLHTLIVYFKQFQAANPLTLPVTYQQAMLLGAIALAILLAMAATSVNAIFKAWGIWWFRLHRLVYVAVIAILVHAFMVGAHATENYALIALSALALGWIILNVAILLKTREVKAGRVISISLSIIILAAAMTYGLSQHYDQQRAAEAAREHGHQ